MLYSIFSKINYLSFSVFSSPHPPPPLFGSKTANFLLYRPPPHHLIFFPILMSLSYVAELSTITDSTLNINKGFGICNSNLNRQLSAQIHKFFLNSFFIFSILSGIIIEPSSILFHTPWIHQVDLYKYFNKLFET